MSEESQRVAERRAEDLFQRNLGDKDRHFFILTDALPGVTPASPVPMFDNWFSRICTLKTSQISLDGERNITLRAKLKAIATEILALRTEIVDAWLK